MCYIFDIDGNCICSCNIQPNMSDLAERGESAVESSEHFDITQICLVDGQIQAKKLSSPDTEIETENADSSISNEIMDMAEIILDMSDTIRALRKGGETS